MSTPYSSQEQFASEALRLEAITACVGFDDLLDLTLTANHPQLDTMIVVTSHEDKLTQKVAAKHGAICVQSDLFGKNGRKFNKGAALNAAMARFQYHGWRLHVDSDIALPDNFRRLLFNHTNLETHSIYGADRVDVIGLDAWKSIRNGNPQHGHGAFVNPGEFHLSPRYVHHLHGYVPIGFFQLWHASCQKTYPWSLGTAEHDDVMFATQWPAKCRHVLPSAVVYHLCSRAPSLGENWDGNRRQPRINKQ